MKKVFFSFVLFLTASTVNAQTIVMGDMNDDQKLTISDVTSIVDVILGNSPYKIISLDSYFVDNSQVVGTWYAPNGTSFTLNEDGSTNYPEASTYKFRPYQGTLTFYFANQTPFKMIFINEVTPDHLIVVNNGIFTIFGKGQPAPLEHEFVDLGLPSGTLWATCNVGASSPESLGDYFAWGETSTKDTYDWSTYKWCKGAQSTITKYCDDSSYGYKGFTDDLFELQLTDDAAYVNWGISWQMPSKKQFEELISGGYTTKERTTKNNVYGLLITSKVEGYEDKSIFLPYSVAKSCGEYWTSTRNTLPKDNQNVAYCFWFDTNSIYSSSPFSRAEGCMVRPVIR